MRYRGANIIEDPTAYHNAIQRSIHARATAKRQREWDAAHPHLAAWLDHQWERLDESKRDEWDNATYVVTPHPLGPVPTFAREGRDKWGSLTEKGTATLQRIYDERTERAGKRAEERAAEAANAVAWTAGRQVVEGVVISIKSYPGFNRYSADTYKWLVKRDDSSRIFTTIPSGIDGTIDELKGRRVRFTVTVEPKAEEPTFAFGKRPAKASIITPTQETP